MRHRPIGIGVQGLADAFLLMRYPFESPEAQELNKRIFETIYFAALDASCELAEKLGPYETYEGSPVSKGVSMIKFTSVLSILSQTVLFIQLSNGSTKEPGFPCRYGITT